MEYGNKEVTLGAQYDQNLDEDRRFAQATPSGSFTATISNPAIDGFFEPGKTYLITVEPVD